MMTSIFPKPYKEQALFTAAEHEEVDADLQYHKAASTSEILCPT